MDNMYLCVLSIIGAGTLAVHAPTYVPMHICMILAIVKTNIYALMHTHTCIHTSTYSWTHRQAHAHILTITCRYTVHTLHKCTLCTCMFALHSYTRTTITLIHSMHKHLWMHASLLSELRFIMMTGAIFFEAIF